MTRILLVAQDGDSIVDWTLDPFFFHRVRLRVELGARVQQVASKGLWTIRPLIERHPSDLVLVTSSWREDPERTRKTFEDLGRIQRKPPIVYLDTFDPASSPFFSILPHVDLFVKKQILKDRQAYSRDWIGGMPLSDFVARTYHHDLHGWHFGSRVPEGYHDRLFVGWNLGTARHLRRSLFLSLARIRPEWSARALDVHYRVSLGEVDPKDWYTVHREAMLTAVSPLQSEFKVVAGAGKSARVPLKTYQAEMRSTRLGVSPFGWGEVTDRDFHIATSAALLVKPDMSHVDTDPNIYRAGETYVPVCWDLSDLAETCRHYLRHPEEAERIARAARKTYLDWFFRRRFVDKIRAILERVHAR